MAKQKSGLAGVLGVISVLIGWLLVVVPPVVSERTRTTTENAPVESPIEAPPRQNPETDSELPPAATGWRGKVVGVSDGDTIDVLTAENQKIRLRLNAIDCPETGQPYGKNAKQFVSDSVGGRTVRVVEMERDRYDRVIAEVYGSGKVSLNVALVQAGLAWHYESYAPDRSDVAAAQREAKSALLGLWGGSHRPIAPWNWRKLSKVERDQYR